MTKRLPTEFAVNMQLSSMMILQQSELEYASQTNFFSEDSPCHIYFIGTRPRVTIDKDSLEVTSEYIGLNFKIHYPERLEELPIKFANEFGTNIQLETRYPYNTFKLLLDGNILLNAKVSLFLQTAYHSIYPLDFLDFKVLYVGQSYGVDGARTAPDRLVSHSTLQGIYSEAIMNNPDSEIWLALASFSQVNLIMFDGNTKYSDEELSIDEERYPKVFDILQDGMNEQQKINFTEAALIRYFQPPYNKIYKESFPNPAHKTYSECYDLDINSVCLELDTQGSINCQFYSDSVAKAPFHYKDFLLHSREDRKSMFEII